MVLTLLANGIINFTIPTTFFDDIVFKNFELSYNHCIEGFIYVRALVRQALEYIFIKTGVALDLVWSRHFSKALNRELQT